MKEQMKIISICIMVLALLAVGQFSYAEAPCENGGYKGDKGQHFNKIMDQIDLSPEQREQLWNQRQENKEKMKDLKSDLKESKQSLRSELGKPDTNEALVKKIVAKMKDTQGKMIDQRVEGFMNLKKILTPEQFQKMSDLKKEHKYQKSDSEKRGNHRKE